MALTSLVTSDAKQTNKNYDGFIFGWTRRKNKC